MVEVAEKGIWKIFVRPNAMKDGEKGSTGCQGHFSKRDRLIRRFNVI